MIYLICLPPANSLYRIVVVANGECFQFHPLLGTMLSFASSCGDQYRDIELLLLRRDIILKRIMIVSIFKREVVLENTMIVSIFKLDLLDTS